MTRKEASEILESARPTGAVHDDPRVAEALRMAVSDPKLARQLRLQREFDAALAAGVKSVPVPSGLRQAILSGRKIIQPHFWQDWRTATAAAAAIILLLVGGMFFINRGSAGFAELRKELIEENWGGETHLDYESSDMEKLRLWLAAKDAPANFKLPPALQDFRPHGARIVETDGAKVSLICMADGPRHLHLFVLDRPNFSDLPAEGVPDFEKCGIWKTASWRHGGKTFVLTGMNYQAFVTKFRKAGRWSISG